MNKKLLTVITVTGAIAVGGIFLASSVFAADTVGSTFAERLAAKLGLTTEAVQTALDETRDEVRTDRLDNAVEDGTITEEQKALILEKQTEIESKIEEINNKELTSEERRTEMKSLMDEVKTWTEENDIPAGLVNGGGMMGKGGHGGMGEGMMRGEGGNGECDGSCME